MVAAGKPGKPYGAAGEQTLIFINPDWKDLPTCVPPCEDTFISSMLDSEGCDTCFPPGAKADSCAFPVAWAWCVSVVVQMGTGQEGDPEPAPPPCPSVEGTGRKVEGCDCQDRQTSPGAASPQCHEKPLESEVKNADPSLRRTCVSRALPPKQTKTPRQFHAAYAGRRTMPTVCPAFRRVILKSVGALGAQLDQNGLVS
eukprot:s54_g5.t1